MSNRPFATERTKRFRCGQLRESHEETISHVENFGCSVVYVKAAEHKLPWSYTVGVYDTCGQPEIITVGLQQSTAHFLLNEAAKRLRQRIDITQERQNGLVGDVECEFRPVASAWPKHLMHCANWFYGDTKYPVLQAVYPDLKNRFPEDDDFDDVFAQPLMQSDVPNRHVEQDFWASNDPESSLFGWKFSDSPHTGVFLSTAVHRRTEAVTYVSHDVEDGHWQFHGDSMSGGEPPVFSCFHHVVDSDRSIEELADLPLGWCAERRRPGEPWERYPREPDPGEQE